ncbi:1454_t:CDS:2, partial [Acaulospora morrowiae]
RTLVNEVLRNSKVTSVHISVLVKAFSLVGVFDYGCGEGLLLSFLIQPYEDYPITRLAGVDISQEIMEIAAKRCQPRDHEKEYLRLSPLTVDLYQGSIDVADERLFGFEAIVCMEVIEHVYPPVLDKFFDIVLGTYKPKVLIVTTPNVEFNVYFPQLKYGTPEATLRIDDHKFEWSRKEFQEWGNAGSLKYNYSVEYTGVGKLKDSDPAVGFATQIAIFRDLQPEAKPIKTKFGSYEHVEKIIFPFYDEPDKNIAEILDVIHYYMQYLCNPVISYDETKRSHFRIDDLWSIHQIRLLCKSRDRLREVIGSSTEFTLINEEEMVAHREYKLDSSEEDKDESYTNNEIFEDDPGWPTDEFDSNEKWNDGWGDENCNNGWGNENCNNGWGNENCNNGWGEENCNNGWGEENYSNEKGQYSSESHKGGASAEEQTGW